MKKYELLLGRGMKLAKDLRIYLCQNCIKMHYFSTKTSFFQPPPQTPPPRRLGLDAFGVSTLRPPNQKSWIRLCFYSKLPVPVREFAVSSLRITRTLFYASAFSFTDLLFWFIHFDRKYVITCSAVAQHCVKAHMQSQWRKPKFDPPVKSEPLKLS